jgi:hypothetical protein
MFLLPLDIEPGPDEPELASLFVQGWIDGRAYRLLLDTGAAQSRVAADAYTPTLEVVGEKESNGVFGVARADEMVVLNEFRVGPMDKTGLVVVRSEADRPSLVGMEVLGDMAMFLDFDRSLDGFAPGGELKAARPLRRGRHRLDR